jgi:hypothetical protein
MHTFWTWIGVVLLGALVLLVVVALYIALFIALRQKAFPSRKPARLDNFYKFLNARVINASDALMRIFGEAFLIVLGLALLGGLLYSWLPELGNNNDFQTGLLVLFALLALQSVFRKLRRLPALRKALGVGAIVFSITTGSLVVSAALPRLFPLEEELSIKWDDCRKVRYLQSRPALDFLKTYSCSYDHSPVDGHIVGGQCVYVVEPLIGTGCEEARIYQVKERVVRSTAGRP